MKPARALLFAFAMVASLTAAAQYQWIDKNGSRVYSDVAPPADVPAKNILKQPRGSTATAPRTEAAAPVAAPAASAASGPATAGVDKALEEKKKQAEAAEAAKKKAEEQKVAQARAENCKRARSSKASLESGMRMARTNDKGEREILDDNQRAAEAKRIDEIIKSDCK
jgi:hypothetical protein